MVTVRGLWLLQTLSVCVCVRVCVCMCVSPALTAYISLTMGWILIKLGENVGTSVRLIVLKFHRNQFSFDVIITSFLFSKKKVFFLREAILLKEKQLCSKGSYSAQREKNLCKGMRYMLRQIVTQTTAILLLENFEG